MITKIFQGPKNIVEEQLVAYTSSLHNINSVSLTTTLVEGLEKNLPRVIYLTVIIMHEEITNKTNGAEAMNITSRHNINNTLYYPSEIKAEIKAVQQNT
jgi:hypothetical protein